MAKLFGALGIADTERIFNLTDGQNLIWTATQDVVARYNADMQNVMDIFMQGTTTDFKERYKLPGFGTLQEEGTMAPSGSVKSGGSWDVSYPLKQYGDAFAWDDVTLAYMTMKEYDLHVQTVLNDDAGTMRILMLTALTGGTAVTFADTLHGSLSIQPLANQDGTLYPAPIGATAEAEQNAYLVSQYAASGISDTNNPILSIVNYLEAIHGTPTGGSNIWVFINNAQSAKVKALADFVPVNDYAISPGDNTATLVGMPSIPPTMRLLGRTSGAWVFEWRRVNANYMFGIHGERERPLMMRVDPVDTGLPAGLNLRAIEESYPFVSHKYRRRCGFGVGNRLNGCIMFLDAGSTYTAPTITL